MTKWITSLNEAVEKIKIFNYRMTIDTLEKFLAVKNSAPDLISEYAFLDVLEQPNIIWLIDYNDVVQIKLNCSETFKYETYN